MESPLASTPDATERSAGPGTGEAEDGGTPLGAFARVVEHYCKEFMDKDGRKRIRANLDAIDHLSLTYENWEFLFNPWVGRCETVVEALEQGDKRLAPHLDESAGLRALCAARLRDTFDPHDASLQLRGIRALCSNYPVDVGAQDHFAWRWACLRCETEVLCFLLGRGADPSAKNHQGFEWACRAQRHDVVRFLVGRHSPARAAPYFFDDRDLAACRLQSWYIPPRERSFVAAAVAAIRTKNGWHGKIARCGWFWEQELVGGGVPPRAARRAVETLQGSDGGGPPCECAHTVALPPSLCAALSWEFDRLARQLDDDDFHPGTDRQVLDIVHPSMDPLHTDAAGNLLLASGPVPSPSCAAEGDDPLCWGSASEYQWVPAELGGPPDRQKFVSPIPGLPRSPENESLYDHVAAALAQVSPLPGREEKGASRQVIVKVAEIRLTPDRPEYFGGVWHLEGTGRERIVASAICYIDMVNITGSRLEFREWVDGVELDYEQGEHDPVLEKDNVMNRAPPIRYLGGVPACLGRAIIFRNNFQHRVSPFRLRDPARPGLRRILCFFLVDPRHPVPSSASPYIPQRVWALCRNLLALRVPPELVEVVRAYLGWYGTSRAEALAARARLIAERKKVALEVNSEWESDEISLCEH